MGIFSIDKKIACVARFSSGATQSFTFDTIETREKFMKDVESENFKAHIKDDDGRLINLALIEILEIED